MNLLGRDQILRLFEDLSAELARRGSRAEVFLVGGGAMALAYDARRATRDLDAIFQPKEEVYAAAAAVAAAVAVARRNDLPEDWLNDAVKGFGLDLVESVYPGRSISPKVQFLLEERFPAADA